MRGGGAAAAARDIPAPPGQVLGDLRDECDGGDGGPGPGTLLSHSRHPELFRRGQPAAAARPGGGGGGGAGAGRGGLVRGGRVLLASLRPRLQPAQGGPGGALPGQGLPAGRLLALHVS